MRTVTCLALLATAALPAVAHANCYSMYDAQNRLTYQSSVAPIDLSMQISEAMRARFPNTYLVMVPNSGECREVRTGTTTQPRFDALGLGNSPSSADRAMQAPLLRNTRPGRSAVSDDSGPAMGASPDDVDSREAARSGTSLSIKREPPAGRR